MKLDFNSIPKFCISLKRSKERRDLVQKEFKKHKLDVKFFDAVDRNDVIVPELCEIPKRNETFPHTPGIYACMLSHLELYKKAAELKLPAIVIFEDDVILSNDINQRIKYVESLDGLDFDFFSLGGHFSSTTPGSMSGCGEATSWNHIYRNISLGGSYAYIITEKVYNFAIRNLNYNFGQDQFLSEVVYKRFACYSFVPFMVACRPCKSEITGAYGEYENVKWHYQQSAIENFEKAYINPYDKEKEINDKKIDAQRANLLNGGG